jgi:hypothetical protein
MGKLVLAASRLLARAKCHIVNLFLEKVGHATQRGWWKIRVRLATVRFFGSVWGTPVYER